MKGGFHEIRYSMFAPSATEKFLFLKGKTSEASSLGRPLLSLWEDKMDAGYKHHRMVRLALKATVDMEAVLDRSHGKYRLDGDDAKVFKDSAFQLAACLTSLGHHYHPKGIFLYHYTLKTHYCLHIALDCEQLNPREGWCYQGEDGMHKIRTLVQSCYRGVPVEKLADKVFQKYIIALSFLCMGRDGLWL